MPKTQKSTLAKAREAHGLTQEQLARKLGVSVGTISRWERGAFKPLPAFEKRLKALLG